MNGKENSLLFLWLGIDLYILTLSIFAAYFFNISNVQETAYPFYIYLFHGLFSWVVTYFISEKKNLYLRDSYKHRVYRIIKRTSVFTIVLVVAIFLLPKGNYSRIFLLSYTAIFFVGEIITYKFIYIILKARRKKGKSVKKALIIGYNDLSLHLKKLFEADSMLGYKFVGFVRYAERCASDIPSDDLSYFIGDTSQMEEVMKESGAEVVFSVFSIFQNNSNIQQQLIACKHLGIRLYLIPEINRWLKKGEESSNVESLGDLYVLNPQRIPLDDIGKRFLKRSFDLFVSGFCILCIFSWLFPLLILIIKLTSKGPAFFRQKRTGLNNVSFQCLKFRSMYMNEDSDKVQAQTADPRITPIGRFIRRWNIDELPQFLNVFVGDMSLVGPRPHMLQHTAEYSKLIEYYLTRHYVKPGITGWAQVNGYRGITDELWKMEKRIEYDMNYIENWSFWWDIKILCLTLFGKAVKENAG